MSPPACSGNRGVGECDCHDPSDSLELFCQPARPQSAPLVTHPTTPPKNRAVMPTSLRVEEVADFDSFVRTVRRKTGASFLIEDAPLRLTLPPEEQAKLADELARKQEIVSQIEHVARLYDFEVLPVTSGFSVWRKLYTDGRDVPNLTFAEVRDSARRLSDLYNSLAPNDTPTTTLTNPRNAWVGFAAMLSPGQKERALSGSGIPLRDLSQNQQDALWRVMMNIIRISTACSCPARSLSAMSWSRVAWSSPTPVSARTSLRRLMSPTSRHSWTRRERSRACSRRFPISPHL
jgi:hypothetical protein